MTPNEKLVRCKEIWRDATAKKAEGERLVLELMRHPDATPEQLQDCRRVMMNVEELVRSAVTALRRAYPKHTNDYFMQHAWWADKYNRYEVKHDQT